MTRTEILEKLSVFDDNTLESVLLYSDYLGGPSYYEKLSGEAKASVARGVADDKAGRVKSYSVVSARLDAKYRARDL